MWDVSLLLCAVTTSAHISELDQHVSVLENRGAMRMPNATVLRGSFNLPRVGLGTGGLKGESAERISALALHLGYRHIDTAEYYQNEDAIGRAIARSGIPHSDLVITSKYFGGCEFGAPGSVYRALNATLVRLGLSSLGIYMMHFPGDLSPAPHLADFKFLITIASQGYAHPNTTGVLKPLRAAQ